MICRVGLKEEIVADFHDTIFVPTFDQRADLYPLWGPILPSRANKTPCGFLRFHTQEKIKEATPIIEIERD